MTQYAIEDEMAACWLAGSFNPCNGTSCAPAAPLEGGAIEIHRIGQDLDCIGLDLSLSLSTFLLGSVDRLRLRGTWICSFSGFFKLFFNGGSGGDLHEQERNCKNWNEKKRISRENLQVEE